MCSGGTVDTTDGSASARNCEISSNGQEAPQTFFSTTSESSSKCHYVQGRADDGTEIFRSLRPKHEPNQSPVIIGIQGTWYDATKFAAYHPGGDIIYEFHQKDATAQFLAYHDAKILQERCKLPTRGSYDFDETAPGGSKLQGAWMKLNAKFEADGRYTTPLSFLWTQVAILVTAFTGLLSMIYLFNQTQSKVAFFVGAMCMAAIWQQSGFLMHDTMHNHMLHDRKGDQRLGFVFGNILLGVSGRWWQDEHHEHHIFTNTIVEGVGPCDPQLVEEVWIQDERLIPFFIQSTVKFILEYQHFYFVPILVFTGLFPIKIDAIVHTGRPFADIVGLALHIAWVGGTLWLLPGVKERVIFYLLANSASGCLAIQVLVSHFSKPWVEKEDTKHPGSWAQRQVEALVDITCPSWFDWFHGGLHIHSVHHLFPRMCRCHYREVYDDVLSMCEEHDLPVDRSTWFEAIACCIHHISTIKDKTIVPAGGGDKTKVA
jgi:acyl-lipid Delta6-acetylenase / acyl-lipid (9-3)-desaturase